MNFSNDRQRRKSYYCWIEHNHQILGLFFLKTALGRERLLNLFNSIKFAPLLDLKKKWSWVKDGAGSVNTNFSRLLWALMLEISDDEKPGAKWKNMSCQFYDHSNYSWIMEQFLIRQLRKFVIDQSLHEFTNCWVDCQPKQFQMRISHRMFNYLHRRPHLKPIKGMCVLAALKIGYYLAQ